jgi:hypothetical protein
MTGSEMTEEIERQKIINEIRENEGDEAAGIVEELMKQESERQEYYDRKLQEHQEYYDRKLQEHVELVDCWWYALKLSVKLAVIICCLISIAGHVRELWLAFNAGL